MPNFRRHPLKNLLMLHDLLEDDWICDLVKIVFSSSARAPIGIRNHIRAGSDANIAAMGPANAHRFLSFNVCQSRTAAKRPCRYAAKAITHL